MLNTKQEWKGKKRTTKRRLGRVWGGWKEKKRWRGRREEEKKPGDSSTVFACGKSVGTVRCKVNGPENPGLVCSLARRRTRWTTAPYLLSGFPYASARVKTRNRNDRTMHRDIWPDERRSAYKFKFAKYRVKYFFLMTTKVLALSYLCA